MRLRIAVETYLAARKMLRGGRRMAMRMSMQVVVFFGRKYQVHCPCIKERE
jgi:hypothetical protein